MTRTRIAIGASLGIAVFIGWVVVPKLLLAANRSRQRRTLDDIRAIATAWEARATERKTYCAGAAHRITTSELQAALTPTYIRALPRKDAWGTDFQFVCAADSYSIRSLGSDAKADLASSVAKGATRAPTDDIIYTDGAFLQYPEDAG